MSGIFNGQRVESFGVNIGLGTDVGMVLDLLIFLSLDYKSKILAP